MIRQISIYRDRRELWKGAAAAIRGIAEECVRDHGCFTIALSGGKTPEELYKQLAGDGRLQVEEGPIGEKMKKGAAGFEDARLEPAGLGESGAGALLPWDKVYVYWGDERFVPHDHPESNCGMARRALLSKVPIPDENVFPIPTDAPTPEKAALSYEETIRREKHIMREGGIPSGPPSFDLILLGMGTDGHTASLYPGSGTLEEKSRLVCAAEAPGHGSRDRLLEKKPAPIIPRVTMTLPLINNALNALFLVTGEDKKETLMRVLSEQAQPPRQAGQPSEQRPRRMERPSEQPPPEISERRDTRSQSTGRSGAPLPAQLVHPRHALFFFTDISLWQI